MRRDKMCKRVFLTILALSLICSLTIISCNKTVETKIEEKVEKVEEPTKEVEEKIETTTEVKEEV